MKEPSSPALRRLLGRFLGPPALHALRALRVPLAVAIMYHEVGDPEGDPATELVPALGTRVFRGQLDFLSRHFDLVPARELLSAAGARPRWGRIPASITFDDDLSSHARLALPLLVERGIPATFFLCGASLMAPFEFWWDRLQRAYDAGRASAALAGSGAPLGDIYETGRWFEELHPAEREAWSTRLAAVIDGDRADAGLCSDDLRALSEAGMEIGFHTLLHPPLPSLNDDQLDRAMMEGRMEIEAIAGSFSTIAYPHGAYDGRVARATAEAGYRSGFTTRPDAVLALDDPMTIGRIAAPESSVAELAYRVTVALLRRLGKLVIRKA